MAREASVRVVMNPGTPWPGHSSRRAGCRATAAAVRTIRVAMRAALASARVTTTACGVRSSLSPARSAAVRNPYRPAARRSRPDPFSRGFAAGGVSERRARIDGLTGRATGFGSGPLSPDRLGPDGRTVAVDADTLILGIETSCDDTGAAVVTGDGRVLGEAKTSQDAIHAPWGGVVPNLAQEAHKAAIDDVVATALRNAGVGASRLDAVAVTVGPGLSMCLRVGVVAAQDVCAAHNIPIVPVHHMEAHGLVARLAGGTDLVRFPFLALLVSGGHNQLILTRGVGDHVILGSTLDDALGEAYDKTARLLGLDVGGGGGPALELLAREGDPKAYAFPVPLRKRKNCDFSYAGLKTAARMAVERDLGVPEGDAAFTTVCAPGARAVTPEVRPAPASDEKALDEERNRRKIRADIAASFQAAAVKHLEERTRRAIGWANDALESAGDTRTLSCVVVAGGVAANQSVRETLAKAAADAGLSLVTPPPRWCTDNGVMVAWAGAERLALGLAEEPPAPWLGGGEGGGEGEGARREVPLLPRWPLGRRDDRATGETKSSKKRGVAAPLTPGGTGASGLVARGIGS